MGVGGVEPGRFSPPPPFPVPNLRAAAPGRAESQPVRGVRTQTALLARPGVRGGRAGPVRGLGVRVGYFALTVILPSMMSFLALSTAATTSVMALYFGLVSAKPTPSLERLPRTTPDRGLPS